MPAPQAMQERRAQLEAEARARGELEQTPEEKAEAERVERERVEAEANKNKPDGERVTITKAEFNELQAAKDKLAASERRTDALRGDLEALTSRLTELEAAAKGSGQGAAPARVEAPTAVVEIGQLPLTQKEKDDFEEDTIALMTKIANHVVAVRLAEYDKTIAGRISEVETVATGAAKSVGQVSTNTFTDRLKAKLIEDKLSTFETCTGHAHWQAFTESTDELTGLSYGEIIQLNLNKKNLPGMVGVFKKFHDKYLKASADADGYAGGMPSGATETDTSGGRTQPKILKYSVRKDAQKKYMNRDPEMPYDKYMKIKEEYDLADREGRVDYNS